MGRQCAYHSSPAVVGPDAVAARLCPPPQAPAGGVFTAAVSRLAEDGTLSERCARFLPLGLGGDDFFGIVAIMETADKRPDGEAPAPEKTPSEAVALHEYVGRFREEAASRYRADRLIGQGPAMRLARRQVELAAASRASVLLVGPAGSGRQHLAAAIHYGTEKGGMDKGLVPLDCSLLGEELLETAMPRPSRTKPRRCCCIEWTNFRATRRSNWLNFWRGGRRREKGTVPICRNGPKGAWHKWGLSPFPGSV